MNRLIGSLPLAGLFVAIAAHAGEPSARERLDAERRKLEEQRDRRRGEADRSSSASAPGAPRQNGTCPLPVKMKAVALYSMGKCEFELSETTVTYRCISRSPQEMPNEEWVMPLEGVSCDHQTDWDGDMNIDFSSARGTRTATDESPPRVTRSSSAQPMRLYGVLSPDLKLRRVNGMMTLSDGRGVTTNASFADDQVVSEGRREVPGNHDKSPSRLVTLRSIEVSGGSVSAPAPRAAAPTLPSSPLPESPEQYCQKYIQSGPRESACETQCNFDWCVCSRACYVNRTGGRGHGEEMVKCDTECARTMPCRQGCSQPGKSGVGQRAAQ